MLGGKRGGLIRPRDCRGKRPLARPEPGKHARLSGTYRVLRSDLHLSGIHAFRHRRRGQLAECFAECFLSLRLRLRMDGAGEQVPEAQPVDQAAHACQSVFRTGMVLKSVAQVEKPPTANPVPFKVGPRFHDRKRLADKLHHIGVSFRPHIKCRRTINNLHSNNQYPVYKVNSSHTLLMCHSRPALVYYLLNRSAWRVWNLPRREIRHWPCPEPMRGPFILGFSGHGR